MGFLILIPNKFGLPYFNPKQVWASTDNPKQVWASADNPKQVWASADIGCPNLLGVGLYWMPQLVGGWSFKV